MRVNSAKQSRCLALAASLFCAWGFVGCGPSPQGSGTSEKAAAPAAQAVPQKPKAVDSSRYLAREGQLSARMVEDQLLGIAALPGGNLATYKKGGKQFEQFLLKAPNVALGAVYLTEIKSAMANPKFVASFGGYFGELNGKPAFVFTKNEYVTGFVGLSREDADAEGRLAAARIP
jgi:hypothetical protein